MAKRSPLERVAKLRASLQKQAEVELGRTESSLNAANRALEELQHTASSFQAGQTIPLQLVHLSERAALSTAFEIEKLKEQKEKDTAVYLARLKDRKQIDALVRRQKEREQRERQRRDQKALDDWTSSNWKRRP